MRSSFVTLAVAVGFAAAQLPQLDKIPRCASYISGTNIAGCKPADIACVCGNKDFIGGISCCLQKDCSKADIDSTIIFAKQLCAASGVKTPEQLVCSSGSGSASGSAATQTGSSSPTATGSQQNTSAASGSATAATTAATSTHTGAAAPAFRNPGGLLGAALAIVAAL
ncbi:CFEM domain protein, putative [Metarhizium acridum CQMa 102]|uniref:CFEM domain protein, putative n=1 Tax=Metarhizium acridum (strain CQMa 102) TaxID=655827 RepID=E9DZK2_METAQ|nr:CFEM domain protein, putative [Metarhizium acridum CQMa 102]EFY90934.1 CFEM domain protein, putative [Metarhizium acridum CQMa 102]